MTSIDAVKLLAGLQPFRKGFGDAQRCVSTGRCHVASLSSPFCRLPTLGI